MPRIKLAYWHGDSQPGDEVDVTDEELAALTRDGRVAEVLTSEGAKPPVEETAQPEPSPEPETEAAAQPETGRKRR